MNARKIEYKGWPNCYRLDNGCVDLVVTADVGPRIIRFGFQDGENEFKEYPEWLGKTGGNTWMGCGGHRLWHAPEDKVRTYIPDNFPVVFEEHDGMVRLIQPVEEKTGIQKEIDIHLDAKQARVTVVHRLWNRNLWTVELAPWALSVMDGGGVSILPQPPQQAHAENLLPVNLVTLWGYTDLSDPRWIYGSKHILLRQDAKATNPQKIGIQTSEGWIAYARDGRLFLKITTFQPKATYPDFGCNLETYTDATMLEVETLGPLEKAAPGQAVEHREDWFLFDGVPMPKGEADVEKHVLPKVAIAKKSVQA
jgi:hypothetical protein